MLSIKVAQWDVTVLGLVIWKQAHTVHCVDEFFSHFLFIQIQQINIEIPTNEKYFPTYF